MKINIELDLASIGFELDEEGEPRPTDDLIGNVAAQIVNRVVGDYSIRSTVESELRNLTRKHAEGIIAEVLSGPITRTDGYGNQRGETTTVREMVMEAVDKWMRLPSKDSCSRADTMGDTLQKIVDEILRNELKPTIDAAKRKVSEQVLRLAVEGAAAALASARVV